MLRTITSMSRLAQHLGYRRLEASELEIVLESLDSYSNIAQAISDSQAVSYEPGGIASIHGGFLDFTELTSEYASYLEGLLQGDKKHIEELLAEVQKLERIVNDKRELQGLKIIRTYLDWLREHDLRDDSSHISHDEFSKLFTKHVLSRVYLPPKGLVLNSRSAVYHIHKSGSPMSGRDIASADSYPVILISYNGREPGNVVLLQYAKNSHETSSYRIDLENKEFKKIPNTDVRNFGFS